jgi:hypothetical protein
VILSALSFLHKATNFPTVTASEIADLRTIFRTQYADNAYDLSSHKSAHVQLQWVVSYRHQTDS